MSPLRSLAAALVAASAVAFGACSGSGGVHPQPDAAADAIAMADVVAMADAAPDGVPSSITYWMSSINGSEVNLNLVPTEPTVPF
jgi:hypothetical protein